MRSPVRSEKIELSFWYHEPNHMIARLIPWLAPLLALSFQPAPPRMPDEPSPLALFSPEWNDTAYLKCNTARDCRYMTAAEKEVIYILNLVHTNPRLFEKTVVQRFPDLKKRPSLRDQPEFPTLAATLAAMKPVSLIYPDSLCFVSARCHAITAGRAGYVGHERQSKSCGALIYGECCSYGHQDPLDIVMALLVDHNVPSLGHREMCLSPYGKIGVSIQPHTGYGYNAVLDFYF